MMKFKDFVVTEIIIIIINIAFVDYLMQFPGNFHDNAIIGLIFAGIGTVGSLIAYALLSPANPLKAETPVQPERELTPWEKAHAEYIKSQQH